MSKILAVLLVLAFLFFPMESRAGIEDLPLPPGTNYVAPAIPSQADYQKQLDHVFGLQARMKSDIANLQEDSIEIKAKLDVLIKAMPGKLQASKTWDGQEFSFTSGSPMGVRSSQNYSSNYSSGAAMASRSRLFSRPIIRRIGGAGGCIGGN